MELVNPETSTEYGTMKMVSNICSNVVFSLGICVELQLDLHQSFIVLSSNIIEQIQTTLKVKKMILVYEISIVCRVQIVCERFVSTF